MMILPVVHQVVAFAQRLGLLKNQEVSGGEFLVKLKNFIELRTAEENVKDEEKRIKIPMTFTLCRIFNPAFYNCGFLSAIIAYNWI